MQLKHRNKTTELKKVVRKGMKVGILFDGFIDVGLTV
jgi:hypothetical protein